MILVSTAGLVLQLLQELCHRLFRNGSTVYAISALTMLEDKRSIVNELFLQNTISQLRKLFTIF